MSTTASIRVLVVDDHRVFAESLSRSLAMDGAIEVVDVAGSASQAVEMAAQTKPDVVLLDYLLPDTDGAQAAAAILAVHPSARIVMLTSLVEGSVLPDAIVSGCVGYLGKTAGTREVVAAVQDAHAGKAAIAPNLLVLGMPRLASMSRGATRELTGRELEVLRLMADGLDNEAIAGRLAISKNTVRNHVQRVLAKVGAHSRLEAVATATRRRLIEPM